MIRSQHCRYGLLAVLALLFACTQVGAEHVLDGCIFYNNQNGNCRTNDCATFSGCQLIQAFLYNDVDVDPQLTAPYINPFDNPGVTPSYMPSMSSICLGVNDDVASPVVYARECDGYVVDGVPDASPPIPGCEARIWEKIEPVCWRGAMAPEDYDPIHGGDWTEGWTYYNYDGFGRTDLPDASVPDDTLSGSIWGHVTIDNSKEWWLNGKVLVQNGGSITIGPGTVIRGVPETIGTLVIKRGGKIFANGTKEEPIIMTSGYDPGDMLPGDFGGIVVIGWAIANCADCWTNSPGQLCVVEGFLPTEEVYYCGANDCDDSGRIKYIRVEYAGYELSENNELNAFVFAGVGINTEVDYCQAWRGSDDLFEWFGGNVFCSHLYGAGGQDDGLDWQMGYRGGVQFAVIQQWGDGSSERGIEADNNEDGHDRPCRSNPVICNASLIRTTWDGHDSHGIRLRRGTDAHIYNCISMGWPDIGLRLSDNPTCARGMYPQGPRVRCVEPAGVDEGIFANELVVRSYPNPLINADKAHFQFNLPSSAHTRLTVFDASGRAVADLVNGELDAGPHNITWDLPSDSPAGSYFYKLTSGGDVRSGQLVTIQ